MTARRLYYSIKPYLGWRIRLVLRRIHAAITLQHSRRIRPVLESSRTRPEGWERWLDGKRFAFMRTHDVEGSLGVGRIKQLAAVEMEMGFRSSFNLVPAGEYRTTRDLRDWLAKEGFEVGVHDLHHDGSLYRSRGEFNRQAPPINAYLRSGKLQDFEPDLCFTTSTGCESSRSNTMRQLSIPILSNLGCGISAFFSPIGVTS
jgi:hypothetical protein